MCAALAPLWPAHSDSTSDLMRVLLVMKMAVHQHQVLLRNCTLSNSSSTRGGAVAAWGNASVSIHDSRIRSNAAKERGGSLFFEESSRGNLMRLLLANNSAGLTGGGLSMGSAKVCARHACCTFYSLVCSGYC